MKYSMRSLKYGTFFGFLLGIIPTVSPAQNVMDFAFFGSTEEYSEGVYDTSIYGFSSFGSAVKLVSMSGSASSATSESRVVINHLAADAKNNRLVYTLQNGDGLGPLSGLFSYDFATGTTTDLSTPAFLSAISLSSGGATFYNGDYYLWKDNNSFAGDEGLVRVSFDGNGNIANVTDIFHRADIKSTPMELGDIVIDPNGVLYITSYDHDLGGQWARLYRIDLNNLPPVDSSEVGEFAYSMSARGTSQLFLDSEGRLVANLTDGNWGVLDPSDASIIEIISGSGSGLSGTISDLASVYPLPPVPEPSGALLLGLGGTLVALRRRR